MTHLESIPTAEPVVSQEQRIHRRSTDTTDTSYEHGRGRKLLADLIERHPTRKKALQIAHQELTGAKEPNYTAAMESIAVALERGRINVFLSYKSDDETAATTIVRILSEISGEKLNITYAGDFGRTIVGEDYKLKIIEAIKDAHWFILLAPEPTADRDWCLFETGLFRGNMVAASINKLICIHRDLGLVSVPPVDEYQKYGGNDDDIRDFLEGILCESPMPGMEPILKNRPGRMIKWAANEIVGVLKAPKTRRRTFYQNFVRVKVPDPSQLSVIADLEELEIDTDDASLRMFGKVEKPRTWGELTDNVIAKDPRAKWLEEVLFVFRKAGQGNMFRPIQATLEEAHGGKVFRPVLHAMDDGVLGGLPERVFQLNFVEEVGYSIKANIGKPLQALATALRMAYRFRWEVLERFSGKPMNKESVVELEDTLRRIELESLSRGLMDPEAVCANFETQEAEKIRAMYARWRDLRNERQTGSFDRALVDCDIDEIQTTLKELTRVNLDFTRLAMNQIQELTCRLPSEG